MILRSDPASSVRVPEFFIPPFRSPSPKAVRPGQNNSIANTPTAVVAQRAVRRIRALTLGLLRFGSAHRVN